jgi:hypothetical protein
MLFCPFGWAQSKPVPRGVHQADQASEQSEKNVPPPESLWRSDPRQQQKDADELARLAESLPRDLEQVNRGISPKDVAGKLKRIEKLAKKLRGELNR